VDVPPSGVGLLLNKGYGMLVLSRKLNETITIGADAAIRITVLTLTEDRVRLGIDAPKEIPVHRQEIYEALQRDSDPPKRTPA
jgi:carbon storage regulator